WCETVAGVLFVEGRGLLARAPAGGVPGAGGVGGQGLVDQEEGAGGVEAELELGVGEEEAARGGVGGAQGGELEGEVAQMGCEILSHGGGQGGEVDVLVVPGLGLGGGREEGRRQAASALAPGTPTATADRHTL